MSTPNFATDLRIGQIVRLVDGGYVGRVWSISIDAPADGGDDTLMVRIRLDKPIVLPPWTSSDGTEYRQSEIWWQFVPAHEVEPYDPTDAAAERGRLVDTLRALDIILTTTHPAHLERALREYHGELRAVLGDVAPSEGQPA